MHVNIKGIPVRYGQKNTISLRHRLIHWFDGYNMSIDPRSFLDVVLPSEANPPIYLNAFDVLVLRFCHSEFVYC